MAEIRQGWRGRVASIGAGFLIAAVFVAVTMDARSVDIARRLRAEGAVVKGKLLHKSQLVVRGHRRSSHMELRVDYVFTRRGPEGYPKELGLSPDAEPPVEERVMIDLWSKWMDREKAEHDALLSKLKSEKGGGSLDALVEIDRSIVRDMAEIRNSHNDFETYCEEFRAGQGSARWTMAIRGSSPVTREFYDAAVYGKPAEVLVIPGAHSLKETDWPSSDFDLFFVVAFGALGTGLVLVSVPWRGRKGSTAV